MAKITSVIDIGSNSCRMVIYQKSSRYAFSVIKEARSRVVLSEGSFESKELQPKAIKRTIDILKEFVLISNSLKANKILTVATSATRDAKNQKQFIKDVKKLTGLNIRVISGLDEARYGAIASINLLDKDSYVSVDIGGGSTELTLVKSRKIIKSISLDLGTVRLKELALAKGIDTIEYIDQIIKTIPVEFREHDMVAIGGTLRAFAKLVIKSSKYQLNIIHGFSYTLKEKQKLIDEVILSNKDRLKQLGIKSDRVDTIKEGLMIFNQLTKQINPIMITTSGVGVREGVYLSDILKSSNLIFPQNFNISIKNISDRFIFNKKEANYNSSNAGKIFDILEPKLELDKKYRQIITDAIKLSRVGSSINYYNRDINNFNFLLYGLNFGFTHEDRLLIALLSGYKSNKDSYTEVYNRYSKLLPDLDTIKSLSNIINTAKALNQTLHNQTITFDIKDNKLYIKTNNYSTLTYNQLIKIKFAQLSLIYENSHS
jgi:exopolyphosphatase/guanosine-5'-triphosphate,3'-diphosphate pyrophosphatase